MTFNDLLEKQGIDPSTVIVLRHRPKEPSLNRVLPWLAAERPEVFNAHQQTQGPDLEKAITRAKYVASFIGHEPAKALFVGLYQVDGSHPLTFKAFWDIPAYQELRALGMGGWPEGSPQQSMLWLELIPLNTYAEWKGCLVIGWPGGERSWWRRSHNNNFPVLAILEQSALTSRMPAWDELNLSWKDLQVLPTRLRAKLSEWRAIYYVFDTSDGKGYVGSASGKENLLGRWINYAATGHGGNKLLRKRTPDSFQFTILQRVSPDLSLEEVVHLENSWKDRLHTRAPYGLNDN